MNEDNTPGQKLSSAATKTEFSTRVVRLVGVSGLFLVLVACNPFSCGRDLMRSAGERAAAEVEERVGEAVEGAVREVTDPLIEEGVRQASQAAGIHLPEGSRAENPVALFDMRLAPFGTGEARLSITVGETTIVEERARAADGTLRVLLSGGDQTQTYMLKGDKAYIVSQGSCVELGQGVEMPQEALSALPMMSPLMGIYVMMMHDAVDRSDLVAAGTEQLGPVSTMKSNLEFDVALIVARAQGNGQVWFDDQDRLLKSAGTGLLIGNREQREPLSFEFERSRLGENIELEVPEACSFATAVTANGVVPGGSAPAGGATTTLYALPAPNGAPAHLQTTAMRAFLVNDMTPEAARALYKAELEERGFRETMDVNNEGTSMTTYEKDDQRITITVSRTGETTQIVLAE